MYADVEVPIPVSLRKTDEQIPSWGKPEKTNEETLRKIMPAYYGMVKCIDDNVGRMLAALRERKLLDRTVIVFTADHGDLCGEHGRLNKGVPYEGSARIPFIVYAPGRIPPGTVVDEALTCVDFLPSILSLLEVPADYQVQGRDASQLLMGNSSGEWTDIAFMRSTGTNGWLCAVTDRYKLVYAPGEPPWLFDLQNDPDELENVADREQNRSIVTDLTRHLVQYCQQYDDPRGEDPTMKAQMQSVLSAGS
jgi:arylsulfatase A-like enzyme